MDAPQPTDEKNEEKNVVPSGRDAYLQPGNAKFKAGNPGRPKGVPNKGTGRIRDIVADALDEVGGVAYLVEQANKNPQAFMSLVGRAMPKEVLAKIESMPTKAEIDARMIAAGLDPAVVWASLH